METAQAERIKFRVYNSCPRRQKSAFSSRGSSSGTAQMRVPVNLGGVCGQQCFVTPRGGWQEDIWHREKRPSKEVVSKSHIGVSLVPLFHLL